MSQEMPIRFIKPLAPTHRDEVTIVNARGIHSLIVTNDPHYQGCGYLAGSAYFRYQESEEMCQAIERIISMGRRDESIPLFRRHGGDMRSCAVRLATLRG